MGQDYTPFNQHILNTKNKDAVSFFNISGDTILVVPIPRKNKFYTTMKEFINFASESQQIGFWQLVAEQIELCFLTSDIDKLYISTHGLGVNYFHLRICTKPKYYHTIKFTQPNNSALLNQPNNSALLNRPNNSALLNQSNNSALLNQSNNSALLNQPNNSALLNQSNNSALLNQSTNSALLNQSTNSALLNQSNNSALLNQSNNSALLNQSNNSALLNQSNNSALLNQPNNYSYIIYWNRIPWKRDDPIYVYDVKNKTEEQHTNTSVINKFPPPPPFSMWGTPIGHFSAYNIKLVDTKSEYEKYKI
jgi:hypothetical protein